MNVAADCVERGAKWLDATVIDWEDKVPLNNLQMADGNRCVAGWVFRTQNRKGGYEKPSPPHIYSRRPSASYLAVRTCTSYCSPS